MINIQVKKGHIVNVDLQGRMSELAADMSTIVGCIYQIVKEDTKDEKAIEVFRDMLIHACSLGLASVDMFDMVKENDKEEKEDDKDDFVKDFLKFLYSED